MGLAQRSPRSCPVFRVRRTSLLKTGGLLVVVSLACLIAGGCATSPQANPPARVPPARFVMVNLSDHEWEIVLTPGSGAARSWRVGPRALIAESLPAGEYEGRQMLLAAAGGVEASRSLTLRLQAGKDYRWRLTTLLSKPAVGGDSVETPARISAR